MILKQQREIPAARSAAGKFFDLKTLVFEISSWKNESYTVFEYNPSEMTKVIWCHSFVWRTDADAPNHTYDSSARVWARACSTISAIQLEVAHWRECADLLVVSLHHDYHPPDIGGLPPRSRRAPRSSPRAGSTRRMASSWVAPLHATEGAEERR